MLFIVVMTLPCFWCSFLGEHSWRGILPCWCCSFLGGLLIVYVVHSWEDSSLFMLFIHGTILPRLCCSLLQWLLLVSGVHSWEGTSLLMLFIPRRTTPCWSSILWEPLLFMLLSSGSTPPGLCGSFLGIIPCWCCSFREELLLFINCFINYW